MGKSRPSEDDFVSEGLSEDEMTALSGEAVTPPDPNEAARLAEQTQADGEGETGAEGETSETATAEKPEKVEETPRSVDIRALQESRSNERQLRQENAHLMERMTALLERLNAPKSEQQAEPGPPEPNDPVGRLNWTFEKLQRFEQQQTEQRRQQEEAAAQRQQTEQLLQGAYQEFQAAEKADPTVREAYSALVQSFAREAEAYGLSGQAAAQHMQNIELQHIAYAKQSNIPLDAYIKGLASARGWSPTPPAQQQRTVKEMADAQERHRSLSDAAGGEAPAKIDAKAIASMSDAQFKKWMDNPSNAKVLDEIMGL